MNDKNCEYIDKAILHMNFSNRRMLIALVTVCATFILTIIRIMDAYLTDYPGSKERLAEECDVSVSTVKRAINRCSFVYRYLPSEPDKS